MTTLEKKALRLYPEQWIQTPTGELIDKNVLERAAFIKGYEERQKDTYYAPVNSSAMQRFGSIHGFFQTLISKKDELNAAGKMFVDCKVFTKEEIISMSKSAL